MIPARLKKKNLIRIVASSGSIWRVEPILIEGAKSFLEAQGYQIDFSKNIYELNNFDTSSVKSRIEDLHDSFLDEQVMAILPVIGGCSSNQLLDYIDYEIIKKNPKIICGYSDITVLLNAIFKMTGLVTYLGPNFVNFAVKQGFEYTFKYFTKALTENNIIEIEDSKLFSDDKWYINQKNRVFLENQGRKIINKGYAYGQIVGGNLCSFQLLQGTKYFPDLTDKVLFLEDDDLVGKNFIFEFDRNLQSLIHQPNFNKVKGIIIGRNQLDSKVEDNLFIEMIKSKDELKNIPIIFNFDFGHTQPFITIPIGGYCEIDNDKIKIASFDFKEE